MNYYRWELYGAENVKIKGYMYVERQGKTYPYLGVIETDHLNVVDAASQARKHNVGVVFINLADGQGEKMIFANVDELLSS